MKIEDIPFKVGDMVKQVAHIYEEESEEVKVTKITKGIIFHIHKGEEVEKNCSYKSNGIPNFIPIKPRSLKEFLEKGR